MHIINLIKDGLFGLIFSTCKCKFRHAREWGRPSPVVHKNPVSKWKWWVFPYGSLPLSYSTNFAYAPPVPLYVYTCNSYNLDYILLVQECFSSLNSWKTGWRKIRRGSGMSWRQLAWPPDVNACLTQLLDSSVARASFEKYLLALSSGMGYSASCRRNGNGCCQGDLPTCHHFGVRVTYYHAAASQHATWLIVRQTTNTDDHISHLQPKNKIHYSLMYIWTIKDINCTIVHVKKKMKVFLCKKIFKKQWRKFKNRIKLNIIIARKFIFV